MHANICLSGQEPRHGAERSKHSPRSILPPSSPRLAAGATAAASLFS